uniref:Uncharacterized protein n=1 Tax=Rhizophora mucronata TaxID=61149 RepID=A0A2P2QKQ3_RHIMU
MELILELSVTNSKEILSYYSLILSLGKQSNYICCLNGLNFCSSQCYSFIN